MKEVYKLRFLTFYYIGDVLTFLLIKTAGTPRLPQLTPQTPTYPSSGKIGGGIIKLYQSRCFYININAINTPCVRFEKVLECVKIIGTDIEVLTVGILRLAVMLLVRNNDSSRIQRRQQAA